MQPKTTTFLPFAIILGGVLVFFAALILAFSPMLWTDHYVADPSMPLLSGCSLQAKPVVQGQTAMFVAHCPSWVSY